MSFLLMVLITGLRFGYENVIADNPVNRLQGKLMMISFILFSVVCLLLLVGIYRIFGTFIFTPCFILFYFSFVLPKRIKKRVLRKAGILENDSANPEAILEEKDINQE